MLSILTKVNILIHLVNLIFCEMNIIVDANGDCDLIQQLFVTSSVVLRKTKAGEDTLYSVTSDSKLQMLKVKNCHPLLKMVRPPKQKQGVKRTNQFICKPCGTSFDSCAKRRKHYLTVDHKPESFAEKKETKKLICRKCSETFITDQDRKAHYYRKHITSSTEAIFKRNIEKSLLAPKWNESVCGWPNLTCESCGMDTEYSINMGVQEEEEKFQCDECLLAIHPDCEEECSVCRHTAQRVEARWALRDSAT